MTKFEKTSKTMEAMLDIDSSCRVCLDKVPSGKRKFLKLQETIKNYKDTTYLGIFETVTGHLVDPQTEPQKLCLSCGDRLVQSFELRLICDKTQKYLQSRVDDIKSEATEEIDVKVEIFEPEMPVEFKDEDPDHRDSSSSEEEDARKKTSSHQLKKYKCDQCEHQFNNLTHFRSHYTSLHSEEQLHSCPHCSEQMFEPFLDPHKKRCRKRPRVSRSQKKKEARNEKKLCPICGIFRSKKHVQEHIDRSNNVDSNGDIIERPFMCDLCGRQTASRNNMFLHMQTMHLRVMMKCKHCKAEFKNRGRLETHIRKIHPEIKGLLQCKFCEYRAVDRSTLHVHLKKHTGQKPHRCEICHHEFITKTKWRDHMATHSDERPFSCETCNATFKTRKTLNSHKKIHLAHDYECPVCAHTYQTSHQLRIHVTKCHPEYPLPPPGTVLSKSWRKRKAEQEMKDLAMKQGVDQKEIEGIVVQDPPPIEMKQYFQGFG